MKVYVTRINAHNLDEQTYTKLLQTLEYCKNHDKYGNFNYRITNKIIRIFSPDITTAKKRGMYFKKRFNIFFNILSEATPMGGIENA
jgi:hypothetical protein